MVPQGSSFPTENRSKEGILGTERACEKASLSVGHLKTGKYWKKTTAQSLENSSGRRYGFTLHFCSAELCNISTFFSIFQHSFQANELTALCPRHLLYESPRPSHISDLNPDYVFPNCLSLFLNTFVGRSCGAAVMSRLLALFLMVVCVQELHGPISQEENLGVGPGKKGPTNCYEPGTLTLDSIDVVPSWSKDEWSQTFRISILHELQSQSSLGFFLSKANCH